MIWFAIIAVAMTAVALAWVLPPLLRRNRRGEVSRQVSNLAILRDQLAELDADLRNGTLSPEQHARARTEIERRTLEEVAGEAPTAGKKAAGYAAPIVVGISMPLLAFFLYLATGAPDALSPQGLHGNAAISPAEVEQMVSRLAARLEANPDDPKGWSLLGRSYYTMGRYTEAVKAYARAVKLTSEDASLYADYADALAMSQDGRTDDRVLELVNQALKIDPAHVKALVMAASIAFDRRDYQTTLGYLERLQRQVPPDTQLGRMVAERADEVRARVSGKPPASAAAASPAGPKSDSTITGRVALSPALASKVAPSDTVFILARATEGPRMPLAVVKRQVSDLPAEFTLGDEQAMSPEMKLSKFREVVIVARVSKSGNAVPQSGDLQGATGNVKVGATEVRVVIDNVVP